MITTQIWPQYTCSTLNKQDVALNTLEFYARVEELIIEIAISRPMTNQCELSNRPGDLVLVSIVSLGPNAIKPGDDLILVVRLCKRGQFSVVELNVETQTSHSWSYSSTVPPVSPADVAKTLSKLREEITKLMNEYIDGAAAHISAD